MGSETEDSQYDYLKYKPPEERMAASQPQNNQTPQTPATISSSKHQNPSLQQYRTNQDYHQRLPNGNSINQGLYLNEPLAQRSSVGNNFFRPDQGSNNIRTSNNMQQQGYSNFSGQNDHSFNMRFSNPNMNGLYPRKPHPRDPNADKQETNNPYLSNSDLRDPNVSKQVTNQRPIMRPNSNPRPPVQPNYHNGQPAFRPLNGFDPYMQPDFGMNQQASNHKASLRPRVPQMNIVRPLGPITPQPRLQTQNPSALLQGGPQKFQNQNMDPNYGNPSMVNNPTLYNRPNFSMGFANNKRLHPTIPEESPRKAELSPSETFNMTTNEPPTALNTSHDVNNTSGINSETQGSDGRTRDIENQSLTEEEMRWYQEESRRALNQNQHKYAAIIEQIDPKSKSEPAHHYENPPNLGTQNNLRQTQSMRHVGRNNQYNNRKMPGGSGQMTSFQMKNATRPMMSRQFTFSDPEMTDLHIYIVPAQYWNEQYNCAYNTVMNYTISAGFIRVYPETPLVELRDVIIDQIGKQGGTLPKTFIFLKSVGRAMTQVKHMQEKQLKVKNFLPPFAYCPEIFIMSRDPIGESEDEADELDEDAIAMNKLTEEKRKQIESMERELEKKKSEAEREQHVKERELEQKHREMEKQSQEKQREIERALAEQSKKLEEERFKLEREIQQQKDEQERQILEMQRNLEKKQQDEHYKRQKELDDKMRQQEQKFMEQNREMENQLLAREADMRKKYQDQEKELMEKERAIEKEKMELEKKEMEHEKDLLQQQAEIEKAKMETEKDKARLEQRKRMQQDTEKLAQMAKGIDVDLRGGGGQSSRPGTSPSKLRFPRPASPQLREDLNHKMNELKGLRDERRELEEFRGELIKKAKSLQIKAQGKRAAARDHWKKKYYEEKKKTAPLDEHLAKLRRELDTLNRRQIGRLEKELDGNQDHATIALVQNKILLSRLTHEISELRWRVEESKLRLTGELKLRMQAQNELKVLRAEVTQKKINAGMQRELQRTAIESL